MPVIKDFKERIKKIKEDRKKSKVDKDYINKRTRDNILKLISLFTNISINEEFYNKDEERRYHSYRRWWYSPFGCFIEIILVLILLIILIFVIGHYFNQKCLIGLC